jgi:hypothetical protein
MRNVLSHFMRVAGVIDMIGCGVGGADSSLLGPLAREPQLAGMGPGPTGGALVANSGEGQDDAICFFGNFEATRASGLRSPSGNATLSCHFEGLDPIPEVEILTGFLCTIIHGGTSETTQTQWIRATNGTAEMKCQFSGKPTYNSAVVWSGNAASAQESDWTTSLSDVPGQELSAQLVDVGLACNGVPLTNDPAGRIALIERGACAFTEKVVNALNAGAVGAVVFNSAAGGEQILSMGGVGPVAIPAVFVARSTGLALQTLSPTLVTMRSCARSATCRGTF